MALHPRIADVLTRIERAARPPFHTLTPAEARLAYEKGAPILDLAPAPLHRVDDFTVAARDGHPVPVRLYTPREHGWAEPMPVLVYFHGGGFTVGSLETHDALCRMLAREADCLVLAVDYRLAPEHKFPVALNDAFDVLGWVFDEAQALGADAARIAVGGDSAGGTLATVCAVLAREAGLSLALQLLIYPGTGACQDTESHTRLAEGHLLTRPTIDWFFRNYLRDEADRHDWRFAPLDGGGQGADVRGVAPAWIAVAEYDPLVDEGVAYADKLRAAGVTVQMKFYHGMIHDFFKMRRFVEDVRIAHDDAVDALRSAFGRSPASSA